MSKTTRTIELRHPDHYRPGSKETLVSRGHLCNYCSGNGFFWGSDQYGHRTKCECPVCKGSGEVDAIVTIEWKPNRKEGDNGA